MPSISSMLTRIAQREELNVASMYLDGDTVFYDSVDGLRTVCQVGTGYWLEVSSELIAEALIVRCTQP